MERVISIVRHRKSEGKSASIDTIPAMLSRRTFFRTAGVGAAVAVSAGVRGGLLSWAEPSRTPLPGGPLLLNSNQNAYGPFASVLALPNPFRELNRYPDHHVDMVTERLAALHKVDVSQVVTGCGSTEILRVAAAAFSGPGRKLVMPDPTFEAIGSYAEAARAEGVKVPLCRDYTHDLCAMWKAAGSGAWVGYICNPNNPTGHLTPRKAMEDFVSKRPKKTMVLIDEAYHDFVPAGSYYASFIDHPMNGDRVIVARPFSKIYGLPGLRFGLRIASTNTPPHLS